MKNIQDAKKQKGESILRRIAGVALAAALVAGAAWLLTVDIRFYKKQQSVAQAVIQEQAQAAQLQQNNQDLREKIANYDNPAYIEKVAREEEDMQKTGEHVVSFIMPLPATSTPKPPSPWSAQYFQAKMSGAWNAIKSIF